MRTAIISDIHSNLEALEKAFELISRSRVDRIYCLGDIVGYGANPNECLDYLLERNVPCILGNHDQAALDLTVSRNFNPLARFAAEWTYHQLSEAHKEYLVKLPFLLEAGESTYVHATPGNPEEWDYIISPRDARIYFTMFTTSICWIGHSHIPGIFTEESRALTVERGKRYIINVGSVGQPRDGDNRLSFGIFDSIEWSYENVRIEYDVETARKKIIAAGLPKQLGDRLLVGM